MQKKTTTSWIPCAIAIVAIMVVELFALSHGINGTILVLSVACMAGLGGFKVGELRGFLTGNQDKEKK